MSAKNADGSRAFLTNFDHARKARTLADKETWRHLRSLESSARMELGMLLDAWRQEARDTAARALEDAWERGEEFELPEEDVVLLSEPVRTFVDGIDDVEGTARVAALPEVARQKAERLGRSLIEAAARRRQDKKPDPPGGDETPPQPPGGDDTPPTPPRSRRRVRVRDVASGAVITDADTWAVVREQLDREVTRLLDGGFDVEIT